MVEGEADRGSSDPDADNWLSEESAAENVTDPSCPREPADNDPRSLDLSIAVKSTRPSK